MKYMQESRQGAHDHGSGSVSAQPMVMGREGDTWDVVFRHSVAIKVFWTGGSNALVIAKHLHLCLKKVQ